MSLIACGINHKTAPIAIREQVFFAPEKIAEPLLDLASHDHVREAAILSTCNRTELYCNTDTVSTITDWLAQWRAIPTDLMPYLYIHQDGAAVRHILRVATGLDSMVLGEPQIFGQLKSAVALANQAGTLGTTLQRLFHYVFSVAKQVRSTTAIGAHPVTVVSAAMHLAERIFTDLAKTSILLIGAGEMITLAARRLREQQVQGLRIANRTIHKANSLAAQFQGIGMRLSDIPHHLHEADIIITATTSVLPLLGKGAMERVLRIRKRRPVFIVDLAVPRNVEPEVGELPDVYLYTIDDLRGMIEENLGERQGAAKQAEHLVETRAVDFMRYLRSLDAVTTIRAYRAKATEMRDDEVAKAIALLKRGAMPEEVLVTLARSLTNKLMHSPTVQLRQAACDGQTEVLALAQKLFGAL